MDFIPLVKFFPFIMLLGLINSQLTSTDYNYMKSTILSMQDESKGMFGNSVDSTYKAVYSLKLLNEAVPNASRICREISFEGMNEVTYEILKINDLLNCKQSFEGPKQFKAEDMQNVDLQTFYTRTLIAKKFNLPINWPNMYDTLKGFLTKDKIFSNHRGSKDNSLESTAYGLRLLALIYQNSGEDVKPEIRETIKKVFSSLQQEFQLLSDNIGLFQANDVTSIKINSLLVEAIRDAHSIVKIDNYEELLSKILNYLITYKYGYSNLDNIYYLLKAIDVSLLHVIK